MPERISYAAAASAAVVEEDDEAAAGVGEEEERLLDGVFGSSTTLAEKSRVGTRA
jgi:hypothetical protein